MGGRLVPGYPHPREGQGLRLLPGEEGPTFRVDPLLGVAEGVEEVLLQV